MLVVKKIGYGCRVSFGGSKNSARVCVNDESVACPRAWQGMCMGMGFIISHGVRARVISAWIDDVLISSGVVIVEDLCHSCEGWGGGCPVKTYPYKFMIHSSPLDLISTYVYVFWPYLKVSCP